MTDLPYVHFLLADGVHYSVNQLHNGLCRLGAKVTVEGGEKYRSSDRFALKAAGKPVGLCPSLTVAEMAKTSRSEPCQPELVVVEARDAKARLEAFLSTWGMKRSDIAVIVVDESEDPGHWGIRTSALEVCDLYLKREWRHYHSRYDKRIAHLPFSWPGWPEGVEPVLPSEKRKAMVFFAGALGFGRGAYLDVLFDFNIPTFVRAASQDNAIRWEEYLGSLSDFLVGFCAPGINGCMQTLRNWEVPAVGVVPLLPYHDIGYEHPLIEDVHCAYYSTPQEAATKAAILLQEPEHLAEMGRQAQRLVMAHHTQEARAQQMLTSLKEASLW